MRLSPRSQDRLRPVLPSERSDTIDRQEDGERSRARARPGSPERPVSTRIYRAAWALAAAPVLVAAFTVARPEPLPPPRFEPTFDGTTALGFATELTRRYPDRTPGSAGSERSARWLAARLREYGLESAVERFSADVPDLGRRELVNLVAIAPGRSPEAIVVMAHRDNAGRSPGADDNGSGTAALVEIARHLQAAPPAHTLAFLSTDGGAHGAHGAARIADDDAILKRMIGGGASILAVVNLDAIAGPGPPRLVFAGETARSPAATLLATTDAAIAEETGTRPNRPRPVAQVLDLAFPFSLHEQAPFLASGAPAITVTRGRERPRSPEADTLEKLDDDTIGELGRSAQAVVAALDESAEVARGTQSYVYLGSRAVRGWTIEFLLLVALLPFLASTVDLFARLRRRHVALGPALRSFASRLGVAVFAAAAFALLAAVGLVAEGEARPISPDSALARTWPVWPLIAVLGASAVAWLVAHARLARRRRVERWEELGGHLAAMLVLAVVSLVVAATNPYALLFLLPSLHAWLWLPHLSRWNIAWRLGLYALGFAGPLLLVASFAVRLDLGLDAVWYIVALAAVGYVSPPLLVAAVVWAAAAAQVGAFAAGRYAPYPALDERPPRGPIREGIRRVVLFTRRRRARAAAAAETHADVRSAGEP